MIGLLFGPIAKYVLGAAVLLTIAGGVYVKIRSDAVNAEKAWATSDALKRTQDAIAAGDAADVGPDRLLDNDGHRRD
jgi:hypothetical protein